jgi:hypothetical protein
MKSLIFSISSCGLLLVLYNYFINKPKDNDDPFDKMNTLFYDNRVDRSITEIKDRIYCINQQLKKLKN